MQDLTAAAWRTSTFCDLNGCVEVALLDNQVAVRDAKDKSSPVLLFTTREWDAFISGVRAGEFDLPDHPGPDPRRPGGSGVGRGAVRPLRSRSAPRWGGRGIRLAPRQAAPVGGGAMGRKRKDEDQLPEHDEPLEPEHRSRRGRKLALLVALAGAAAYMVRRNQRKAEIDEGIWHEAPSPAPATATSTTSTA